MAKKMSKFLGKLRVGRYFHAVKDGLKGKGFHLRSPEWRRVRREHLKKEPMCQWCGGLDKLEVHHIMPFHLNREKELDDSNLITLCEAKYKGFQAVGGQCHLEHGHLGRWSAFNPNVREDCNTHISYTLLRRRPNRR